MAHSYLLTNNPVFWVIIVLTYAVFDLIVAFLTKKNPPYLKVCTRIRICLKALILIELTYRITYHFIQYVFK